MRFPIIDTTRTISIESDIVEIDGVDREIWAIVERCPVYGVEVDYYATKEEALAALNAAYDAPALPAYGSEEIPF